MTPVESAIHDFVREHAEAETRFLAEIVKVPSDNPPGDCARSAEAVATLLEGLGFQVERHKVPESLVKANGMISATNLIARRRFRQGADDRAQRAWRRGASRLGLDARSLRRGDRRRLDGRARSRGVEVGYRHLRVRHAGARKCGAALNGAVELHVTYDEEAGGEIGPRYLSRTASRIRIWRSAPASPMRSSTPITAAFISRSRSSAARPMPPAPRPASTRSKRRTQSSPPFMAGAAAFRRGPRPFPASARRR